MTIKNYDKTMNNVCSLTCEHLSQCHHYFLQTQEVTVGILPGSVRSLSVIWLWFGAAGVTVSCL